MGIWGQPEGNISAAYRADTFLRIKIFISEGQLPSPMEVCRTAKRLTCYAAGSDSWIRIFALADGHRLDGLTFLPGINTPAVRISSPICRTHEMEELMRQARDYMRSGLIKTGRGLIESQRPIGFGRLMVVEASQLRQ